ncbi:MAG: hypothetical protein AAFR65_09295 [Pseudomonadota bacterium]
MAINAFIQGFVTIAIAVIGLYFSWESRRADNYQAVADLALSSDPNVAGTAAETMELMTVDCGGDVATDLQQQRLRDILCPLSTHHRFILTNMIEAIREAERAEMLAMLDASAEEDTPVFVAEAPAQDDETGEPDSGSGEEGPAPETQGPSIADAPQRLVEQINDRSRSARRTAVAQLERTKLTDGAFIDTLIDQLEDPGLLGDLTVQGRFNVVYLLNQAPSSVWDSEERVDRCLAAIEQVYERERAGETSIGDQTRAELSELKSKMEARQAARSSADQSSS